MLENRRTTVASLFATACLLGGFETAAAQSVVRPIPGPTPPAALGLGPAATPTARAIHRWERLAAQPELRPDELVIEAFGGAWINPTAGFSDSAGELASQRAGWGARFGRRSEDGDRSAIEVELESSFYDFGTGAELLPGVDDPFNDLYRTRLAGAQTHRLSEHLRLHNALEVQFAGGDETQLDEGVSVGGALGVGVAKASGIEIGVGLAASSRLEDDALLIPYVSIDWRPNERVHVRATGPQLRLDWRASERVDVGLEAAYEQRQYRLNDDGAGQSAAFRDEQIDLGAELGFRPFPGARLSLSGGYTAWRELTVLSDGEKLFESELDPRPYVGLGLALAF